MEIDQFEIRVIRSKRRKRTIALQIDGKVVVVQCPAGTTDAEVQKIIVKHRGWILEKLAERQLQEKANPELQSVLYFGQEKRVEFVPATSANRPTRNVMVYGDTISISAKNMTQDSARVSLESWLMQEAHEKLPPIVEAWSLKLGLAYRALRIKSQKRRWGSCSSARNINLNWRLIGAPKEVIDYVVVHELCHLVEMNHSHRFWKLVSQALPAYKKSADWLKENGHRLYF